MPSLVAVIDDDHAVRESSESLIRSAGFAVRVFDSAEQFLKSPYLRKAACLVLDVRMPGMSGPELRRKLLSEGYEVPVIFITAAADEEAKARELTNGAVAYLTKPFDEKELLPAIDRALKSGSRRDHREDRR